jgi:hypothetical protein
MGKGILMLKNIFSECAYSYSHGVDKNNLGLTPLYYSLAYINQAKTCVVLGSGGGIVPMAFRQAQLDLKLKKSKTILIDGFLPDAGYGHPLEKGGWARSKSILKKYYPDIICIQKKSEDCKELVNSIDILHIDAEHTYKAVIHDFSIFKSSLNKSSIITFHDTQDLGVQKAVQEIAKKNNYEILNFRDMASGLSILRKSTKNGYEKNIFEACKTRPKKHQWTLGPKSKKTWGSGF